jgi:hypothetical protein
VFYNWYVDHQYLTILSNHHFRAACSTATSGFSNKVYKGFGSYNEAHHVWHAFVNRNVLPPDVLIGLSGRPIPLPPTMPQPNIGGLADPLSPTPLRHSQTPLQAPATTESPRQPRAVMPFSMSCTQLSAHDGLTLKLEATLPGPVATISVSHVVPTATQILVGSSSKQKSSDAEDFWVVLTGVSPGVYKGR